MKYVEKHCIRIIRNSKNEDYLWILDFLKRDLIRLLVLMFELIKPDFQYDYYYKSFLFSCIDGAGNKLKSRLPVEVYIQIFFISLKVPIN